eukprot:30147-Pelagococcus_subviridis.AAC.4
MGTARHLAHDRVPLEFQQLRAVRELLQKEVRALRATQLVLRQIDRHERRAAVQRLDPGDVRDGVAARDERGDRGVSSQTLERPDLVVAHVERRQRRQRRRAVQRAEIVLRDVQRPEIREVKKPAEGFDRVGLEVQRLEADVVFQCRWRTSLSSGACAYLGEDEEDDEDEDQDEEGGEDERTGRTRDARVA